MRFPLAARPAAILIVAVALSVVGAGCSDTPTGPTPPQPVPPPGASPNCHAINYPGLTGGERIQSAVNDAACATVYIAAAGPDAEGAWLLRAPVRLRSNLTLTSTIDAAPATLRAQAGAAIRLLVVDGESNVTIRHLTLHGARSAHTGVLVVGSSRVTFSNVAISGMTQLGIMIRDRPSADVTIASSTFEDNGYIDVRTETDNSNVYHSNVVIERSVMQGTTYGVALANCGGSDASRCHVRDNVMRPKRNFPGTGVDLNRSHSAVVSRNHITECGRGLTVDDTQNASIASNTIEGCSEDGILLANGAVVANRPWLVSGNTVVGNTVRNNGGVGLASYRIASDAGDRNMYNVFNNNQIQNNARGGCATNAEQQVFFGNGPQSCMPSTR